MQIAGVMLIVAGVAAISIRRQLSWLDLLGSLLILVGDSLLRQWTWAILCGVVFVITAWRLER